MKFDKKMQALCGLQGIFDLFNCKTPEFDRRCVAFVCIDKISGEKRKSSCEAGKTGNSVI